jgi:DNA recombination protein RmuC
MDIALSGMNIALSGLDIALTVLLAVLAVGLIWLFRARDSAVKAQHEAERELAVAKEQLAQAERRVPDIERLTQQMSVAAAAAVLKPAQEISSKLLDDHKRESAEATKEAEARVVQASEQFAKQFESIVKKVSEISGQAQDNSKMLGTLWRSLSSPGGAGQLAEVGLANTLKSFGLEEGRDYKRQFHASDGETGQGFRPDAVVFLPDNGAVVIDSKASKFLLDIAAAEGTEKEVEAYRGLVSTMNQHLKDLASKDYRGAVLATCRAAGRQLDVARMVSLMYLPSEAAIERINRADPGFISKARDLHIIPAGPAGLHCALLLASTGIGLQRQVENHQQIIESTRALVDRLGVVLGYALSAGKDLKSAAESFGKFANSVNKRLLPQARKLSKLGVQSAKPLPGDLPDYSVVIHEGETIEGEAEEVETPSAVPPRPRLIGE